VAVQSVTIRVSDLGPANGMRARKVSQCLYSFTCIAVVTASGFARFMLGLEGVGRVGLEPTTGGL